MDFTKNYKLYKLYNGSYINNLQYVNANLDKIDELLAMAGGDSVISGTSVPSSDLGEDNMIYLQYEIDSGVTSIKAVYGKIDGEWLVLPDGGDVEDVRVNGTSVVSNKIAYITLPENGNISYGTAYPSGGEDADVYLRLGVLTDDILSEDAFHSYSSTYHPMTLSSFTRIARNQFSFSFQGNPDSSGNGETAWFDLAGLVPGKTYTLEFDHQFGSGTTFPWQSYHDRLIISGTTVYLEPSDTALHHYTTTFTYTEGATAWFNYPRVDDNRNYTSSFTNFTITGSFANNIEDIYGKCEGMWERYLGGLKYFVETPDSLYGSMLLSNPRWSCLAGYYFDYQVEDHIIPIQTPYEWSFTKDNDIPAIAVATYYVATGNYAGSGVVLVSKDPDGTLYTVDTQDEPQQSHIILHGGYTYGNIMLQQGNSCNMVGTYEYDDETWYYSAFTIRGLSGGAAVQDGNILFNGLGANYGTTRSLADQVAYLFQYVDPVVVNKCYSGLHQGDNLAFFAGGIDEDGTDAPIKIFTDGTTQGFPGGLVDDVEVDGSSVVVNKVANIDLATPLATKQNVLTAGANITIQNDVISATSAEYRDFQGATQLADGANGLVPKPFKRQDNKFLQGNGGWGSVVLTGTSAPTSGQGFNDNIYVEYDGTSSSTSTQLYSQRAPGGKTTWSMELDTSSYDQVRVELVWGGVDTTISVADIYSTGVTVTLASGYAYLTFDHSTVTYSNNQYFNDWILRIYGINLIITPTSCEEMYTKINGTWLPLGLQNSIQDVEVDGVSVVTSGVAEIDLSNYATLSDVPEIEANPQDTPTAQLDTLTIDGTVYELGGGDVEANPSGTATDTLTKLGIEGTVYEIQGGGGGSSGSAYREVVLWNNPTSTASWSNPVTMTLNDDITNYHELKVVFSNQSGNTYGYITIPVSEVLAHNYTQYFSNDAIGGASNYVLVNAINEITGYPKDTGTTTYYVKVIGIKYGGNLSPIIYSTEEREVGVWIDNKPLYARTLKKDGTFTSNTSIPIPNYDTFENVFIADAWATDTGNNKLAIPYVYPTSLNYARGCYINPSNKTVEMTVGSSASVVNPRIMIYYTKTTDTAGSGEYNTLGIPNVHYSNDEKVIGTWFGETLYQQCIDLSSITISAGSTVTVATIQGINLKKALGTLTETDDTTYAIPDGGLRVKQYGDDIKLTAMGGSSWVIATGKLIIEYTKTT